MTIDELKEKLLQIKLNQDKSTFRDTESDHIAADEALLEFINNEETSEIFNSIHRWYA
jgi:hypothetical protein